MVWILLAEGREGKWCFSMFLQCFWPRLWRVFSHAVAIRWLNEAGLKRGGVLQIDANCRYTMTSCHLFHKQFLPVVTTKYPPENSDLENAPFVDDFPEKTMVFTFFGYVYPRHRPNPSPNPWSMGCQELKD